MPERSRELLCEYRVPFEYSRYFFGTRISHLFVISAAPKLNPEFRGGAGKEKGASFYLILLVGEIGEIGVEATKELDEDV